MKREGEGLFLKLPLMILALESSNPYTYIYIYIYIYIIYIYMCVWLCVCVCVCVYVYVRYKKMESSLSLFYSYFFGRCLSEMSQLVWLPYSQGKPTCYSDRLHDFSVTIGVTLLFEHSPSRVSEIKHFEIFHHLRENKLLFLISKFWECFMHMQRSISIITVS